MQGTAHQDPKWHERKQITIAIHSSPIVYKTDDHCHWANIVYPLTFNHASYGTHIPIHDDLLHFICGTTGMPREVVHIHRAAGNKYRISSQRNVVGVAKAGT